MCRLTIELVPSSCWYANVRSNVSSKEWDQIRKKVYISAGYRCEICGGQGKKHPVECHEEWAYDDIKCTQTLKKMIALCPDCHRVKHIGLAQIKGELSIAINHLAKVNDWSLEDAELYAEVQFEAWANRSSKKWILNIDALKNYLTKEK